MLYDTVAEVHTQSTSHAGYKKVAMILKSEFYGIPRQFVQEFCKCCPTCELARPQICRPAPRLIIEKEFMHRIQVDLIDMRNSPDGNYNYICHVVDHFSKYHILFPLKSKTPREVALMLEERVLAYVGLPRIFQSDNGKEFVNLILKRLFDQWGGDTLFVNGRSPRSQFPGCVKNGNKVIRDKLRKLKIDSGLNDESSFPWASWLPKVMYAMNIVHSETTKLSPFEVVFGMITRGNILAGARTGVMDEEELPGGNTDKDTENV
nr:KRAB-A domain-containing protein 2-like [Procambarus clarkii]